MCSGRATKSRPPKQNLKPQSTQRTAAEFADKITGNLNRTTAIWGWDREKMRLPHIPAMILRLIPTRADGTAGGRNGDWRDAMIGSQLLKSRHITSLQIRPFADEIVSLLFQFV